MSGVLVRADWIARFGGAERVVAEMTQAAESGPVQVGAFSTAAQHGHRGRIVSAQPPTPEDNPHHQRSERLIDDVAASHVDFEPEVLLASHHHVTTQFPRLDCPTVLYVHRPPRFLWEDGPVAESERAALNCSDRLSELRARDLSAVAEADIVLANSTATATRIQLTYGVASRVLTPPVEGPPCSGPHSRSGFMVSVGRAAPTKRLHLLNSLVERVGVPLVYLGSGRSVGEIGASRLVTVRSGLTDHEVRDWVSRASLFVTTADEDYGLAAADAIAMGTPVVGPSDGGLVDVVEHGVSGLVGPLARLPDLVLGALSRDWDPDDVAAASQATTAERFRGDLRACLRGLVLR